MLSLKPSPSRIALVKNVKMRGFGAFLAYFSQKSTDFGDFFELLPLKSLFLKYCLTRSYCQEIILAQNIHSEMSLEASCCVWNEKYNDLQLSFCQLSPQNLRKIRKLSSDCQLFLERIHPNFNNSGNFEVK